MIAIKITKEAGLITRGAFIFGDTQETLETAEYTMRWVEDHCDLLETATFQVVLLWLWRRVRYAALYPQHAGILFWNPCPPRPLRVFQIPHVKPRHRKYL